MERLWAPWRMKYISHMKKKKECFLCRSAKEKGKDKKNYVLFRGKTCLVVLNLFPYNNVRLMVAPYRHIGKLDRLNKEERAELMELTNKSVNVLKKGLSPDGFNVGINLGKAAGAGLVGHLHVHIVPRWVGDTNFMSSTGGTKVISQSLDEAYKVLKKFCK